MHLPQRPSPVDALLAGFLALVVLAEAFTEQAVQAPALHALIGTTVMVAIAWRRAFPLLITVVVVAGNMVLGATGRAERAASLAAAMSRADRLEEEKPHEAEAAAAKERTRLARELHDIVSHSISMIAIQTQAVRRRLGRDHPAEAADLAAVEGAARDAMAEMRRLFGVLAKTASRRRWRRSPGSARSGGSSTG